MNIEIIIIEYSRYLIDLHQYFFREIIKHLIVTSPIFSFSHDKPLIIKDKMQINVLNDASISII